MAGRIVLRDLASIERGMDGRIGATIGSSSSIATFAKVLIDYAGEVITARSPPIDRFTFGPLTVDLSVVGEVFRRRLTTAISFARLPDLKHLGAGWRIVAIDSTACGVDPPPPMNLVLPGAGAATRATGHSGRKLMVRYNPSTQTWRALSLKKRLGAIWTANPAQIPDWEDAAPFRDFFHWMTLETECFLAHAAAVGSEKAGVLLIGPGGSGKSTTTAAVALRGLKMAGDDFVLVDPQAGRAYALYDCLKLNVDSAERFPELKSQIVNPVRGPAEKGRIHLYQSQPCAFARSLPITVALLPRVTGEPRTSIVPASPSEAVRALVPSTIFLVDGGEAETIRKSSSFLRKLPLYHCRLGTEPFEAMDKISAFIDDLAR